MNIQMLAGALTNTLGAPNNITISSTNSVSTGSDDAGIVFYSNGNFAKYLAGVPIVQSAWISPKSNFSEYEIKATLSSGDTPDSGTIGSWEALSTTRAWTISGGGGGAVAASLLIEIRWTGNNVVQDSATYNISGT